MNNALTACTRDSLKTAASLIGFASTLFTIWGVSLKDCPLASTLCLRVMISAATFVIISVIVYVLLHKCYKDKITFRLHNNNVAICFGDIFETEGYKVIGCDTQLSTTVDDKIISRHSLHGQFLLNHADIDEVKRCVYEYREYRDSSPEGYKFEKGRIIPYDNTREKRTYLLLALTDFNDRHEAHTNMPEFIQTLMYMWREINSVYNGNDIVLPLLGTGITRFDDGFKDNSELLLCMLYTLYASGLTFNSEIKIILRKGSNDLPLYEYKNLLQIVKGGYVNV